MAPLEPVLAPPPTRAHVSVARLSRYWYVACTSRELRLKPLARTVLGLPLVLFRSTDGPTALLDRCPHRNVPLSAGAVREGTLECAYHGWRFGNGGRCVAIPALCEPPGHRGRDAEAFPVIERDGLVWVYGDAQAPPTTEPPSLGCGPGYATVRAQMTFEGSLHAVAENTLDVPHTAFLHRGLFRKPGRDLEITCQVTRSADRVECRYVGEPRPTGLIGRLLAPQGGTVEHADRFLLPCLTQVEYRLGESSHVVAWQALTPETDFVTRIYAVLHFRVPLLPGWLVRLVVEPVARRILRQDAAMLRQQTASIQRFGGERYVSTDVDVLGPHIWHLLKRAERGDAPTEPLERTVTMRV